MPYGVILQAMHRLGVLTADEYRKTISKDAALERRFQPVTIDEPTVESTISILRGLKSRYEVCSALVLDAHTVYPYVTSSIQVHHGVEISDGALVTGLFPSRQRRWSPS